MNVEDRRDHAATHFNAPNSGGAAPSGARSIVHSGRLWLLLKKALPHRTADAADVKHRCMHAEPRTVLGPQGPASPALEVAEPGGLESEGGASASNSPPQGFVQDDERTCPSLGRMHPLVALRMFGLLGLGVVILLTLVLELLNNMGALGLVMELFDRLRLLVAVASGVALAVLVAVMLRHRSRRASLSSDTARSR